MRKTGLRQGSDYMESFDGSIDGVLSALILVFAGGDGNDDIRFGFEIAKLPHDRAFASPAEFDIAEMRIGADSTQRIDDVIRQGRRAENENVRVGGVHVEGRRGVPGRTVETIVTELGSPLTRLNPTSRASPNCCDSVPFLIDQVEVRSNRILAEGLDLGLHREALGHRSANDNLLERNRNKRSSVDERFG